MVGVIKLAGSAPWELLMGRSLSGWAAKPTQSGSAVCSWHLRSETEWCLERGRWPARDTMLLVRGTAIATRSLGDEKDGWVANKIRQFWPFVSPMVGMWGKAGTIHIKELIICQHWFAQFLLVSPPWLALTSAGDGSMSLLVYTGRSTAMYLKLLGTVFKIMAGNCSPHPVGLFHR